MDNPYLQQLIESAKPINVDTLLFEKNDPFFVRYETDIETNGKVVNVYTIELLGVDPRWITSNTANPHAPVSHEAFHIGHNEVLVKIPSSTWTYLNNYNAEIAALNRSGVKDGRQLQAYDIGYSDFIQNPARHFKTYRLIFPDDLDNTIFNPDSANGAIDFKLATVGTKYDKRVEGKIHAIVEFHENLHWSIAAVEEKRRATKPPVTADIDAKIDSATKGLGNLFV